MSAPSRERSRQPTNPDTARSRAGAAICSGRTTSAMARRVSMSAAVNVEAAVCAACASPAAGRATSAAATDLSRVRRFTRGLYGLSRADLGFESAAHRLPEIELHAEAIGDFAGQCETQAAARSEERRVGKECRSRGLAHHLRKKE